MQNVLSHIQYRSKVCPLMPCNDFLPVSLTLSVAANFQFNVTSGNSSEMVYLNEEWYLSRQFTVSVLAILFILPMLMFKSIGALSYTRWGPSL